ncbi:IclR family transcriptional regulator [Marivibrio halodurans]|uniref:IclR family transcriptional regulator n=1 Tax=Marivibrio halodurans TaxID=2039722 RepID=A0A8J7V5K1_9PROT|nr:IclR family transcriptional regulator [Marivibrio halodurans]MBP5859039.1 IclR family transcriptional regulator [Marivibrio halodurans]
MESDDKSAGIPTNMRLLIILEELAQAGVPVTPTAVNETLNLPKPTIHRLFATLEEEGFLQRELDGRSYSAGRRLRKLSTNVLSSLRIRTARLSVLNALADEVGETCNIAVPDRDVMIYLDRVETKWPLRIQLPVGTEVPFYCTASGKMYLSTLRNAHLDRYLNTAKLEPYTDRTKTDRAALRAEIMKTRERGYALDDEEFIEGMIAVAVAIKGDMGRLVSTLSFHAPTQRLTLPEAEERLPSLHRAARELGALLVESA